jgi:4-carboxymuconolactone decarboxylase
VRPRGYAAARGAVLASRSTVGLPFEILLGVPELCQRVAALGDRVRFESSLDGRMRETAIVATAGAVKCEYELLSHIPLAFQEGVAEASVELCKGREAMAPKDEAVIVRFCRELINDHQVSDATFDSIRSFLSEPQVVELCVTVGYYALLSDVINVFQP